MNEKIEWDDLMRWISVINEWDERMRWRNEMKNGWDE